MAPIVHFNTPYAPSAEEVAAMIAEQEALEQAAREALVDDIAVRVAEILINNTNLQLVE